MLTVSPALYPLPVAWMSVLNVAVVLFSVNESVPGVPDGVEVGVGVVPLGGSTQKTHFALRLLVPAEFFARTCHEYWSGESAAVVHEVVLTHGLVISPSLITTWYWVAPAEACQESVGV